MHILELDKDSSSPLYSSKVKSALMGQDEWAYSFEIEEFLPLLYNVGRGNRRESRSAFDRSIYQTLHVNHLDHSISNI